VMIFLFGMKYAPTWRAALAASHSRSRTIIGIAVLGLAAHALWTGDCRDTGPSRTPLGIGSSTAKLHLHQHQNPANLVDAGNALQ
jgi:hypothetical protein